MENRNSRRTIGVFAVELDDAYQSVIWRGIEYQANQLGLGVITFLGSRSDYPIVSEESLSVAYNLASGRNVDGIVLISSAIATLHDSVDLEELFSPWGTLPMVSVGIRIPGLSSITVEEVGDVSMIIRHLIEKHQRHRFALITGPSGHHESVVRRKAVQRTLEQFGTPIDHRLVASGSFKQASGQDAAERLLATGLPFDALICLNDRMAQGALTALARHGIRVPADVSLTGFDGSEFSKYASPPLTTVIQPLYEMGLSAVNALDNLLHGGEEQHRMLTCTPVIRESCGCVPSIGNAARSRDVPAYASPHELQAISELTGHARGQDQNRFIERLNTALDATGQESGALDRWNEYLSVIEFRVGEGVPVENRSTAQLFSDARVLIGEKMARYQAGRRITTDETFAKLRLISSLLAGAFELSAMFSRLEEGLSLFGIRTGFLITFEPDCSRTRARVLLAMDRRTFPVPAGGVVFDTVDILPGSFGSDWRRSNWVLTPLVFENEPLGYLLLPGGFESPLLYDILQEQIASNLKGTLLLEQVRTHEQTLKDEVGARTRDLQRINEELSREVVRRAELEQEVIDVSNRTMERIGQDLHDDLCQHLSGITLLTSTVRDSVAAGEGTDVATLDHINNLLTNSIVRVKQISRGLVPVGLEAQGLAWKVESLVLEARRGSDKQIEFHASDGFAIPNTDTALQVYRIIQEAFANALQHSGADRICISLYDESRRDGPLMIIEIRDNGYGIPPDVSSNGLGLRIMRYRAGIAHADISFENIHPGTRIRCCVPGEKAGENP